MTRSFRKEKRKSMVSMSHYDFQDASYSGYHKKYLKLVAATIFFTIIGIIIFIQLQKDIKTVSDSGHSGHYRFSMASDESVYQPELSRNPHNTAIPPTHLFSRRFQKRQWTTVGYVKTSKENEFRQHLKQMQNLISDLKYNL